MLRNRQRILPALLAMVGTIATIPAAPVGSVYPGAFVAAMERCEALASGEQAMLEALAADPATRHVTHDEGALLLQVLVRDEAAVERLRALPRVSVRADVAVPGARMLNVAVPPLQWRAVAATEGVLAASAPAGRPRDGVTSAGKLRKTGTVESQAVEALNVDAVRRIFPGIDGTGVKVGVIADSINRVGGGIAASQATGELPPSARIEVLSDGPASGTIDEGRAMMEHIYDIAPGVNLGFSTSMPNQAALTSGIQALSAASYDIVVDDAFFEDEPFFQPGPAAVAIKRHTEAGGIFMTAAGNYGIACYAADWVDQNSNNVLDTIAGRDDFRFTPASDGASVVLTLQSEHPYVADATSLAYFDYTISDRNRNLVATSGAFGAYKHIQGINPTPLSLAGAPYSVSVRYRPELSTLPPDGKFLKVVAYRGVSATGFAALSSETEGPIVPHAGLPQNIAVGAAPYFNHRTPQPYSSRGFFTVFYDEFGDPLEDSLSIFKPNFLSIDACNTSFFGADLLDDPDGLPNFSGTSAAAPHAAGVAALMVQAAGGPRSLTQTQVSRILERTGLGDYPENFDRDIGFGTINALAAVMAVSPSPDTVTAAIYPNHFGEGSVQFELADATSRVAVRVPVPQGPATVVVSDLGVGADPLFVAKSLSDGSLMGVGTSTHGAWDGTAELTPQNASVISLECASQKVFSGPATLRAQVDGNSFSITTLPFDLEQNTMAFVSSSFASGSGCRFYDLVAPAGQIDIRMSSSTDAVLGVFQVDGTQLALLNNAGAGGDEIYSGPAGQELIVAAYNANLDSVGGFTLEATVSPDIQMPDSITPPEAVADILRVNPTSGQSQVVFPVGAAEPLHLAFVPEVSPISFSAFVLDGTFAAGIYDAAGQRLAVRGATQSTTFDNIVVTPGQTHFFRVLGFPATGTSVDFRLVSTQASFAAAGPALTLTASPSGLYSGQLSGQLGPAGDNDYLRLALPADAEFPFQVSVVPGDSLDVEFEVNDSIGGRSDYRDSQPAGAAETTDVGPAAAGRNFTIRIAPGSRASQGRPLSELLGNYTVTVGAVRAGSSVAAALSALLGSGATSSLLDSNSDGVLDSADIVP